MHSSFINLKRAFLLFTIISIPFLTYSQAKIKVSEGGAVVTDTNQELPDASAVLDVNSTTKGVLFPKLTTEQRDLIPSPAEGLLIYNSTKKVYEFFNGTEWLEMGIVSGTGGSGGTYDTDAQLVFDRMPTLTASEKTAINDFIVAEKAAGNYAKYDEFFLFPLGSTNGLIGFKSKTATAHGGVTWDINGATFDGSTGYIDSDFNPSVDGNNYTQNNSNVSSFISNASSVSGDEAMFGGRTAAGNGVLLSSLNPNTNITYQINGGYSSVSGAIESNSMYSVSREDTFNQTLYKDGSQLDTDAKTSVALVNQNVGIGANIQFVPAGAYSTATISTLLVSAAVGFNHTAHNDNVRQLLTDLGVDLTPAIDPDVQAVYDRMPTLTEPQKTAINTFILAEKAAGNYAKYDEFFLFPLGPTNGMIGFKSKTATAHGGVTWGINGATFDGVDDYIDCHWVPSADGTNYKLNDAVLGVFVYNIGTMNSGDVIAGVNTGSRLQIMDVVGSINGSVNSGDLSAFGEAISGNNLYSAIRDNTSDHRLFKNGSELSSLTVPRAVGALPTNSIYVGASYYGGGGSGFSETTVSSLLTGGTVGFNHPAHNTNLRQLLTDLGLTL